jgi:autophagy-related protein 5
MVPHLFSPAEAMEKAYTVSKESSPLERPKPESVTEGTSDEGVGQAGTDASTSSPKETGGAGRSPAAEPEELEFEGIIRIQGIEPSLDLPLEWVARNLCGPENFIHFIVISRRLAPQLPSRATD